MEEYYHKRANEYGRIYETPEWGDDLADLKRWVEDCTRDRSVLEVAAGTGYWTETAAKGAKHITATDYSKAMLANAATRRLGANVALHEADAYALPRFRSGFDVGMAHLWWSHVPKQRQREFLAHFASRLQPGASFLMTDQVYLSGYSPPTHRRDRFGNRYELRTLENGDVYQIVKNYPTAAELKQILANVCDEIDIKFMSFFWRAHAIVRAADRTHSKQRRS